MWWWKEKQEYTADTYYQYVELLGTNRWLGKLQLKARVGMKSLENTLCMLEKSSILQ